jgi:hypothetical protein
MRLNGFGISLPWRGLLKIALLVLLIVAANLLAGWMAGLLKFELLPSNEDFVHRMIMTAAVVYAVLLAVPFVPGIEIGLALIAILGPPIVFLVYVSTVAGLSLSFAAGRLISLRGLIRLFDDLRLQRASRLLLSLFFPTRGAVLLLTRYCPVAGRRFFLTTSVLHNRYFQIHM